MQFEKMQKNICAISTGPETHLDHLAPLCEAMDIPLIVVEPDHEEIARTFYPMVEIHYIPLAQLHLEALSRWDAILTTCKFWALELRPMLSLIQGKNMRFIFTPHGYSDKEDFIDCPVEQDIDLVYGPAMQKQRRHFDPIEIGNIRHAFYLKYQDHFDGLARRFFRKSRETVLYAPTWESRATPTSFFHSIHAIVNKLAKKWNLLVKLHPLLEENNPALYHRIISLYASQVTFIEKFPSIYPLLEKTDIYLGDHSSIGYDFLLYDRPLFFLTKKGSLMNCGKNFEGTLEDSQEHLSQMRQMRVREIFKTPPLSGAELMQMITLRFQTRRPFQTHLKDRPLEG